MLGLLMVKLLPEVREALGYSSRGASGAPIIDKQEQEDLLRQSTSKVSPWGVQVEVRSEF